MPKAKKIGRPKLPKGHAKGKIVPVRLNERDLKLFTKRADKRQHKSLSAWIRHTLIGDAMERNDEIKHAAMAALVAQRIEDTSVDDVITHTADHDNNTDRRSIHFREANGKYFKVVVDTAYVLKTYGSIDHDTLKQEIIRLLQQPKDYLS